MSRAADLAAVLNACRQGLEDELVLLAQLSQIAARQRTHADQRDLDALQQCIDERNALTAQLLAIEQTVRALRAALAASSAEASPLPGFADVSALHSRTVAAVQSILSLDGESIQELEGIVMKRRAAARSLDRGESTLEAYGRVTAPEASAALMSDRG
jgi:hypothetical protein